MIKAKDIMTKKVITVKKDSSVEEVCAVLIKNRLSGLPVVDKSHNLVGFISEKDIIASVNLRDFLSKKVKDMMTKKVCSVSQNTSTDSISRIFTEKPYKYLPVVKGKKVVGVISRKDLIEKLLGQYY